MKQPLLDVERKINCEDYTLKEIALYFEKYNGFVCKIETNELSIKFIIEKYALPHILGLQYAYANKKDSRTYKGKKGFERLRNGQISLAQLKKNIKTNTSSSIAWQNVKRRIEYLPMFLNTLEKKSKFKIICSENVFRNTLLKGSYILYKQEYENGKLVYPMFSLKETPQKQVVIETFIVEDDITLLYGLEEQRISSIELISPIDNTQPTTVIREKVG